MLRDVMDAKSKGRPYVITFCGVNGVGKSTNLAKVCFWLLDNNYRVLVVGGDTFRAGLFLLVICCCILNLEAVFGSCSAC